MPTRLCALALLASAAISQAITAAAPIHVQVNMVGGYHPGAPPEYYHLTFANIQLDLKWNPDALTPLPRNQPPTGRLTAWPVTNTSATMTVTGAGDYDGVFSGTIENPANSVWGFVDGSVLSGDAMFLPAISFQYFGNTVRFYPIQAQFDDAFFSGEGHIFPKPFTAAEADWGTPLFTYNAWGNIGGAFATGFAVLVPEDSTLVLAGTAAPAVFWLRRRK